MERDGLHGMWVRITTDEGPRPRRGHIIRKIDNSTVLLFGGYQFGKDFDWGVQTKLFYLDLDTLQWRLITALGAPTPTDGPGISMVGDKLASTGGSVFTGGLFETCNITEVLDLDKHLFLPAIEPHIGDNLEPRCWHMAASVRVKHRILRQVISAHVHPAAQKLYTDPQREQEFCMVFGGRCNVLNADGTSVTGFRYYNDVMLLDVELRRWVRVQTGPGPTPRAAVACWVVSNRVYIFGGRYRDQDENNYFYNDMWCFDANTLKWEPVMCFGDIPSQCAGATAEVLTPTKILVTGGFVIYETENDFEYYNRVHLFDLETNTWTELKCGGDVPQPLTAHALTRIDRETIMVYGGDNRVQTRLVTHNLGYLLHIEPDLFLSHLQRDYMRMIRASDAHSDLVIQIEARDLPVHSELLRKRCPKLLSLAQQGVIRIDDRKLTTRVMSLFLDFIYANHVTIQRDMRVLALLQLCAQKYKQAQLIAELRQQVSDLTRLKYNEYTAALHEFDMVDHAITPEPFDNAPREVTGNQEWHLNMEAMLFYPHSTDFALHVTDESGDQLQSPVEIFNVHRFVLANRSEFFAAAIRMALQRNNTHIFVEDISIRGARALLLYLYSDNMVLLESIEICLEVLHFATFSAMIAEPRHDKVIKHCRGLVIQALTLDNCLDVYEAALTVSDPILREQIKTWIAQRAALILKKSKEEGLKLRDELMHLLSPEKPVVESQ
eukprot:TRINITY_DN5343_c0_g1_i1.p1 TRINITY_DN5343_c0_g1~~TRINITY_DN5343_c0_g1_i1.p1  ORF type:complete len:721 (+),score=129.61 TRINITY_DN5343_c0_g1_i1:68-2230(+)